MLKATATDKEDGDLTDKIVFSGQVGVNKVGEYTVTLTVTDKGGKTATKTVKVIVKNVDIKDNQAPVILVKDTYTIKQGSAFNYNDLKAEALDKEDGNLTKDIKYSGKVDPSKVGNYEVTLTVTDALGAKDTKVVRVTVVKDLAPEIVCNYIRKGQNNDEKNYLEIEEGKTFDTSLLGAKATDFEDNNVEIKYEVKEVKDDKNKVTGYEVTLTAEDSNGSKVVKVADVKFVADKAPIIKTNTKNVKDTYKVTVGDVLDINKVFEYYGVEAYDRPDGQQVDITSKIEVMNKIDTTKEGNDKTINLKVTDNGKTTYESIKVNVVKKDVVEFKPVVTFNSNVEYKEGSTTATYELEQFAPFDAAKLFEAKSVDEKGNPYTIKYDGTVDTGKIGPQYVKVVVSNSKGQEFVVTVTVTVKEPSKPVVKPEAVIELGDNVKGGYLKVNYDDAQNWPLGQIQNNLKALIGAKATNAKDGIKYEGLNIGIPEKDKVYTVTLEAQNEDGVKTTKTVNIVFVDKDNGGVSLNK